MTTRGIDATRWDRSSVDLGALKAQGHTFIIGYFSNDPSKDWTREWANQVAFFEMFCMTVLETDVTSGGLGGYQSGLDHGRMCHGRRAEMGMDLSCPMAVAFDYDVPSSQWALLDDYLRGFAAGDGGVKPIPYTNGAYILHALDLNLIFVSEGKGGWLSCSSGFAGFHEALNSGRLLLWQENCGTNYDGDIAYAAYHGQWQPGVPPTATPGGFLMSLSDADQAELLSRIRNIDGQIVQPHPSMVNGAPITLVDLARWGDRHAVNIESRLGSGRVLLFQEFTSGTAGPLGNEIYLTDGLMTMWIQAPPNFWETIEAMKRLGSDTTVHQVAAGYHRRVGVFMGPDPTATPAAAAAG